MAPVHTKYLIPTMECLARLYRGEPVWVSRLRACLAGKGYTEFTGVYRGLALGIKLGLVREVAISRKQSRYEPTPIGLVKGGILDAASEVFGFVDDVVLEFMNQLAEYLFYYLKLELPVLIVNSILNPRRRGLKVTCCDSYGRCFEEAVIPSREDVYYTMLTIKFLAGIPVRGLRPSDYGEVYYFAKLKMMNHLRRWELASPPRVYVNPAVAKIVWAIARLRLSDRFNIDQGELKQVQQ
jgi:hypothetical protein